MKHCESELSDTYLSLLDASGKLIDYNDDADFSMGCGGGAGEAYLSKILDAARTTSWQKDMKRTELLLLK